MKKKIFSMNERKVNEFYDFNASGASSKNYHARENWNNYT